MKEFAPFLLQGLLMGVDELYCHRRRVLNRWERWGHPVDTLVFSSCLAFLYFAEPGRWQLMLFALLGLVSSLMISKDEWQHRELCSGFENWLHSLLFMLHPVLLIWAGYLWWTRQPQAGAVIGASVLLSLAFFLYQLLYWNVWNRDR